MRYLLADPSVPNFLQDGKELVRIFVDIEDSGFEHVLDSYISRNNAHQDLEPNVEQQSEHSPGVKKKRNQKNLSSCGSQRAVVEPTKSSNGWELCAAGSVRGWSRFKGEDEGLIVFIPKIPRNFAEA